MKEITLAVITSKLIQIQNNIQTPVRVETNIEKLIQSAEFMGKQFDNFNSKVDSLLKEIKNLKIENEKWK
jgi:hypothetical protein